MFLISPYRTEPGIIRQSYDPQARLTRSSTPDAVGYSILTDRVKSS